MKTSLFLYVVVFVGGAVVLALEILGTRVLGPFYGVSLFLWSALISITLAALSLGYVLGGWWADRIATVGRLCLLLAGAGIWTFIIPWLKYSVLDMTEPLGLRAAVLVAAFILFFPPLMLLGMVGPYAIKLRARSLDEVGRSAGNLYAVSTVGSVFAALLTGFFLIPNVGVFRLLLSLSAALLLTAIIGYGYMMKKKRILGSSVAAAVVIIGYIAGSVDGDKEQTAGLVGVFQSPYGEIRVVDIEGARHMLIDGGIHSIVDTETGAARHPYVAVMEMPLYLTDGPGDMLLIGLGGGSLARSYHRAGWNVDAVEIDRRVAALAYRYFGLDSSEAEVFIMDGREYLTGREKQYDLVLLDAFGSSAIPFHLVTEEVFGVIASRIREGGMLGINVETVGWKHRIVLSLAATLKRHFSNVLVLPMAEPPNTLGNLILLASNEEFRLRIEPPRNYHDPFYRFSRQYYRNHAWDNRFDPEVQGRQVITDDLNPVDLWSEEVNYVARRALHDYFRGSGLGW